MKSYEALSGFCTFVSASLAMLLLRSKGWKYFYYVGGEERKKTKGEFFVLQILVGPMTGIYMH